MTMTVFMQVCLDSSGKWSVIFFNFPGFVPFFRNKFPGLFQDFSRTRIDFSRALKFTLTSTIPRSQCQFSLLPSIHFIFLAAFHRFPGLSRTSGLFPGLSSPGKCHNKIPGLSRTRMNPDFPAKHILVHRQQGRALFVDSYMYLQITWWPFGRWKGKEKKYIEWWGNFSASHRL